MTSPLQSQHAMERARWRCMLCPTDGIGGLKGWGVHYINVHYADLPRGAGER